MNSKNLIIAFLLAVFVGFWFMYKTHDLTSRVEILTSEYKSIKGCEEPFEGKHISWPEPEKETICRSGWEYRESMDGVAISKIESHFKNQRLIDLAKILGFSFLITMIFIRSIQYISIRIVNR